MYARALFLSLPLQIYGPLHMQASLVSAVGSLGLGYHRRPARATRADTAETLNFVGKAPTALDHANFTMPRRRASPVRSDHLPPRQPLATLSSLEIHRRSKLRRWLFRANTGGAGTLSCAPGAKRKSHLDVRPGDVRCT